MKYDWSKAPEWARYAATDEDGTTWWFENEPVEIDYGWDSNGGRWQVVSIDWRDSLEARPEVVG